MASVASPIYSFCEMEMDAAKNAQKTSNATKRAKTNETHEFDRAFCMLRKACCTSEARNIASMKKETKASSK